MDRGTYTQLTEEHTHNYANSCSANQENSRIMEAEGPLSCVQEATKRPNSQSNYLSLLTHQMILR